MIEAERMRSGGYRGTWDAYLTSGLWHGVNLPRAAGDDGATAGFSPPSLAATERRWRKCRRRLLEAWIQDHPGSRPWGWWLIEAVELRAPADGREHPYERPDGRAFLHAYQGPRAYPWRSQRGLPVVAVTRDDVDIEYESELEYLLRLRLLRPAETAVLIERGDLVPAGGGR